MSAAANGPTPETSVELAISGMTCASCAMRIEKKLNKLDGVSASVNYATEKAAVRYNPEQHDTDRLLATISAAGYAAQLPEAPVAAEDAETPADTAEASATRDLAHRLLISATLALPVLVLAMIPALQFDNWQWLSLTLASPVIVWGAWPFHRATLVNARHGASTMDTLVSIGTVAAYLWSLYALFFGTAGMTGMKMHFALTTTRGDGRGDIYLEVASVVIVFLLGGRYLEARARQRSSSALRALAELGARHVELLASDGTSRRVPINQLTVGDEFFVRPGEKIATDGVVVEGVSAIDLSLLTGESVPVEVTPGSTVVGAALNAGGRLIVRATRVGADTELAQITRLVNDAQNGKAPVQRLADRVSAIFVPAVLVIALLTLVISLAVGVGAAGAFTAAVAVLIVACPCALGLATPTALLVGTGRGAQLGLLIRGPQVLERTQAVDTVVLDKTGTVTTGQMRVVGAHSMSGAAVADDMSTIAAALESASEHPIGAAIAAMKATSAAAVIAFENLPGLGVRGQVQVASVTYAALIGRESLLIEHGIEIPAELTEAREAAESQGQTPVFVAYSDRTGEELVARGVIVVADTIKPTSADGVAELRRLGLRPVLLTGDNARAAQAVARTVVIAAADVIAEVRPEQKLQTITELQAAGHVVAMVGDGVNDAAALTQADLGIAMATGSDVAVQASDITLMRSDLRSAGDAIRLARHTLAVIKQNLFWAFAYNVVLIPVAAVGLLNPLFSGAAMALSSVFVVSNSLRLRRHR